MQTFLPYADFAKTASCLDTKRLCNQRNEAYTVLETCLGLSEGWKNHPAVKMWKGKEYWLAMYGIAICDECINRGYKETCKEKFLKLLPRLKKVDKPAWIGSLAFHRSHRSNLLRKKPEHYSRYWKIKSDLPYIWPNNGN